MRAMAVDMIGREVGQQRDIGHEARRQIDLEAGHFQHIDGLGGSGGASSSTDLPILPPIWASNPAAGQDMADQRRGGGFAVGAGDGDDGRAARLGRHRGGFRGRTIRHRRSPAPCAALAWSTTSCGLGWVSGTPGLNISAAMFSQGHSRQGMISAPASPPASRAALLSSQAITCAPPAFSDSHRAQPRAGQAEDGDGAFGEGVGCDHPSTAASRWRGRASASTTATIQKRITMVGSVQPSCS